MKEINERKTERKKKRKKKRKKDRKKERKKERKKKKKERNNWVEHRNYSNTKGWIKKKQRQRNTRVGVINDPGQKVPCNGSLPLIWRNDWSLVLV